RVARSVPGCARGRVGAAGNPPKGRAQVGRVPTRLRTPHRRTGQDPARLAPSSCPHTPSGGDMAATTTTPKKKRKTKADLEERRRRWSDKPGPVLGAANAASA